MQESISRLDSYLTCCPHNVLYSTGARPYPGTTCVFLVSFNLEWPPSFSLFFGTNTFAEFRLVIFTECHPIWRPPVFPHDQTHVMGRWG